MLVPSFGEKMLKYGTSFFFLSLLLLFIFCIYFLLVKVHLLSISSEVSLDALWGKAYG